MSPSMRYAAASAGVVGATLLALWPFLDPASRSGVLAAAGIAVPVQVAAFTVLVRFRDQVNRFLAAWIGGTLLRMAVLATVAFLVIRSGVDGAVAMLLALVAFFFGLLLLEPVFFRAGTGETGLTHG